MVVAPDGAEAILDEGEERTLFLFGELGLGGYAFGTAVDGADAIAHLSPKVDYFFDILLGDGEFLFYHVGV